MIRRVGIAFIAWYALSTTGIIFAAFDLVVSLAKTVTESFPCADHDCGCRTAEQCRTRCCCFPKETKGETCRSCSKRVRVTLLSTARCAGGDKSTVDTRVPPHIAPASDVWLDMNDWSFSKTVDITPASPVHSSPPDKIPT
jgi:hypothetical protein